MVIAKTPDKIEDKKEVQTQLSNEVINKTFNFVNACEQLTGLIHGKSWLERN